MRQQDLRPQSAKSTFKREPGYLSYWAFALSLIFGLTLGIGFTRLHGPWQRGNAEPGSCARKIATTI